MATATKKGKKEEAYSWKAGASSGHTTNLKQSILRLLISIVSSLTRDQSYKNVTAVLYGIS